MLLKTSYFKPGKVISGAFDPVSGRGAIGVEYKD